MKNIATPVPAEEFQTEMRKCLKKAAFVNYTKISTFVKIEGNVVLESLSSILLLEQMKTMKLREILNNELNSYTKNLKGHIEVTR